MNIIMHDPENPEQIEILQKKVAALHAEAVLYYVQRLSCSKEQKLQLITELRKKGLP